MTTTAFRGVEDQIEVHVEAEFEELDKKKGGAVTKVPFWVTYKRLPRREFLTIVKETALSEADFVEGERDEDEEFDDDELQEKMDVEIEHLKKHTVSWRGLKDKDDKEISFTKKTLAEALDIPEYYSAIARGFTEANTGKRIKVNRKNSSRRGGGGRRRRG